MSQHPDPRESYHRELRRKIDLCLLTVSEFGWNPDDIRHVIGSHVDHLLFESLHLIPASRTMWRSQCHPAAALDLSTDTLETILTELSRLGPLKDHPLLREDGPDPLTDHLSPEQQRARHRIVALLRKAESTNFEEEAEALVTKAQQLRQRYRISHIESAGPAGHPGLQARRIHLRTPWIKHQYSLLSGIARTNSCAAMLLGTYGIATVIGAPDDVEHTADLFGSLNRQRHHFMITSPGAHEAAQHGQTTAYRRAFLLSYTSRIIELLELANREAGSGDGVALPVLADRSVAAHHRLSELFPAASFIRLSARHRGGYRDGAAAAQRSFLGGDSRGLETMSA